MSVIISFLVFGWLFARRLLGTVGAFSSLGVGLGASSLTFLAGLNSLALLLPMRQAVSLTLLLMMAFASVIAVRYQVSHCSAGTVSQTGLRTGEWVVFCALSFAIYLFAVNWQFHHADYDFWLDFPQQALMAAGQFPPINPFFPEVDMYGNYGRNLLIAGLAAHLEQSVMTVQLALVPFLQLSTLATLAHLVHEWTGSRVTSLFCCGLSFFGLAVGGWIGLVDLFYHNGSLAHLGFLHALLVLRRARFQAALFLGALQVSVLAVVQIPYFGLVLIGGVLMLALERDQRSPRAALIVLALSLAVITSGPLRSLSSKSLTVGDVNQSQRLTIKFPKSEFGKIWVQPWSYWQTSCAWESLPWQISGSRAESQSPQYQSILSWNVLQLHWIAVYLAPLTLSVSLKTANRPALFFGILGVSTYIIPAVFDFGPIHEAEYYRWEVVVALCLALSLGCVLGWLWDSSLKPRPLIRALVLAVAGLCCLPSSKLLVETRSKFTVLPVPAEVWLTHNIHQLSATPLDLRVGQWLKTQAKPEERLLTNFEFSPAEPFGIQRESLLVGLSGVSSTGRQYPDRGDFVGTPPFRHELNARRFWNSPASEQLAKLAPDWLLCEGMDQDLQAELSALPELKLEKVFSEGERRFGVYRVKARAVPEVEEKTSGVTLCPGQLLKAQCGQILDFEVSFDSPLEREQTWRISFHGKEFRQELLLKDSTGGGFRLPVPTSPGAYELTFSHLKKNQWLRISGTLPLQAEERSQLDSSAFAPPPELALAALEVNGKLGHVRLRRLGRSASPESMSNLTFRIVALPSDRPEVHGRWVSQAERDQAQTDELALTLPLPELNHGKYRLNVEYRSPQGGSRVLIGPSWNVVAR